MYKRERPVSPSSSTSTIGNARVSPMENDLIDSFSLLQSEKAVQEIIQQPVLQGVDEHLVEFSEALRTVAKALRRVTEDKASAQAEAAEWKHKYEIERAHNLQLEWKGGRCSELNVERSQESQDQAVLSDATRVQCELCSGKDDICAHEVLQDCKPDSESSAVPKTMVMKASFKLNWYCKGEKGDCHKHEIVDFARGNITAAHSSKQISLKWESPPHTVLVLNKPNSTPVQSLCLEMVRWLKEHTKLNIFVEPRVQAELLAASSYYGFVQTWLDDKDMLLMQAKVNLVVTLGGDGTVLWAASMFKGPVPPIVSFSVGSLGFMTPFSSLRYPECLNSILHNPFSVTLRHRLQCHIIRDAAETETDIEGPMLVLNEVTIDRGISSFLTNLECYCDNSFVTRVHGDGLILSTASGSTAYSLAAGGSMVHPQVPGILFTPICPHSLSFRPLMLPENVTLRVAVPFNSRSQAWVSFDGKGRKQLAPGDALVCSVAPWPVPTVCLVDPTHDFLRSIQDDLHWNLRKSVL